VCSVLRGAALHKSCDLQQHASSQQMARRQTIRLCRHHAEVGIFFLLAVLCFVQLTGELLLAGQHQHQVN
jgi:hypothetical protein